VIDLYSEDETRRYKAQLDQRAVWQGQTVLPQGTQVLLKIVRSKQPQMPNVATVNIYAVSTGSIWTACRDHHECIPISHPGGPERKRHQTDGGPHAPVVRDTVGEELIRRRCGA